MKKQLLLVIILCFGFVSKGYAQTFFSGGVYNDTTWTTNGSPFIINGNVTIFPGITLSIDPGVEIKIDPGVIFDVRGSINATGSLNDTITFTSSIASPIPGSWPGLIFTNAVNSNSTFVFCKFLYATQVIYLGGCTSVFMNIEDSRFSYNLCAISGYSCASGPGYPISIYRTDFTFNNYCFGNNNATAGNISIYSSRFLNNNVGLKLTESISIYNTILCGNNIASDARWASFYSCIFLNNNVAIKEKSYNPTVLDSCVIAYNDTGIIFQGFAQASYNNHNNIFCNNNYSAVVQGPYNIDMSGNCWCSTTPSAIAQAIYDGYDNIALGLVQYSPINTCDSSFSPIVTSCDSILLNIADLYPFFEKPSIYPNPATTKITVFSNKTNSIIFINLLGDVVIKKYFPYKQAGKIEFDISSLPSGLYLIKTDNGISKFIKQ